jgi:hypothetical protein
MPCRKSLAGKAFKEGWLRGLEPPTLRSTIGKSHDALRLMEID